jgi:hypothetical protein
MNKELSKKATQEEYETAITVYAEKGQYGVYDYAKAAGITSWSPCDPCDDNTPDTEDNSCLVCGSAKDNTDEPE